MTSSYFNDQLDEYNDYLRLYEIFDHRILSEMGSNKFHTC
jgi:hypothetical protein